MGLSNLFKRKPPTHEEKVELAYQCYRPEMVDMLLPGGIKQASDVIISLAKLYGVSLEPLTAKEYHEILSTYSDVFIRQNLTNSGDELIVTSLKVNHGEYIKDDETAEKVLKFCKMNMSDSTFTLESPENMKLFEMCDEEASEDENLSIQNLDIQDDTENEMYGLCMEKPIYTSGQEDTEDFLTHLKTTLGENVICERGETLDVEGIAGKVIVYNTSLPSGKSYKTLYINEHGINPKRKIPKGFAIDKTEATNEDESEERFYFENITEFLMYVGIHKKKNNIVWESGDKYVEAFKKGYHFFECEQFARAIDCYKECLKLNPIGVKARFELVECYIVSGQLSLARQSLYEMKDFLYNDSYKARFYRRLGYIATEERSYKEACACYRYSLAFENHPSVSNEITYIESQARTSYSQIDEAEILGACNIPLL